MATTKSTTSRSTAAQASARAAPRTSRSARTGRTDQGTSLHQRRDRHGARSPRLPLRQPAPSSGRAATRSLISENSATDLSNVVKDGFADASSKFKELVAAMPSGTAAIRQDPAGNRRGSADAQGNRQPRQARSTRLRRTRSRPARSLTEPHAQLNDEGERLDGAPLFSSGLPAALLAGVLLLEPGLQRREIFEHRLARHLAGAGERLERVGPRLATRPSPASRSAAAPTSLLP